MISQTIRPGKTVLMPGISRGSSLTRLGDNRMMRARVQGDLALNAISVVEPLGLLARSLSDMQNLTGRESPSVIT